MENNKAVIIENIKKAFDEAKKDMESNNLYGVKIELPNEVIVDSIIVDLIGLGYHVSAIEKDGVATLTVYYKHEEESL